LREFSSVACCLLPVACCLPAGYSRDQAPPRAASDPSLLEDLGILFEAFEELGDVFQLLDVSF
jgi:hypothetical protein